MDANTIGLELIEYLQDTCDCFLLQTDYVPSESWYDDNTGVIDYKINDDIISELPIDITEFLEDKADALDCDIYDLIEILETVVYNVNDLGITEGLGYVTINFIITEDGDRYFLQDIVL